MASDALLRSAPFDAVRIVTVDCAESAALRACAPLRALENVRGIFHLAGMLDDGVVTNMTAERIRSVVAPKAAAMTLLDIAAELGWSTEWLVAYSSTTSLLGCAASREALALRTYVRVLTPFTCSLSAIVPASRDAHTYADDDDDNDVRRSTMATLQVPRAVELRCGEHAARSRCAVRR